MLRRTRRTLWIVAAVLLVLAAAVYLRFKAPPEAARLLPESDGIVYVNLRPLRALVHKNLKPVMRAPEYQSFIDATGIDWERDLEEAAVALHRMPDPHGPNGPVAYSMVLVGKLNGKALAGYLEAHANSKETYEGHTIYSLPSEGRTVRVAQIAYDMVAISNTPSTEQIHSILDRHRTAALPFPDRRCWPNITLRCRFFPSPGGWAKSAFPSPKTAAFTSSAWNCLWSRTRPFSLQ